MFRRLLLAAAFCATAALVAGAQDSAPPQEESTASTPENQVQQLDKTPVYRVNVVERTTKAVNYRNKGGTTQVDFQGTSLMPKVDGKAKVTAHTGRFALDISLHHLDPARTFGPEYLTYVAWAITPQGRPVNLGEVIPHDGNANLQLTTDLQSFGLIVTAEPYFAVTWPSDIVVAENKVLPTTKGPEETIDAKFDLLQRGEYTIDVKPSQLPATGADKKTPVDVMEAENAIAIADAAGAEQYAPGAMQKAKEQLARAEDYVRRKQGATPIGTAARAAVQTAEDARLLTLRQKNEERAQAEREAARKRVEEARAKAQAESERASVAQEQAQQAQQEREAADQARQQAEQARLQAEQAAQQAAQERAAAEQARQAALEQQQQLAQQAQQAHQQAEQAEQARQQAEQQAQAQRQRLLNQLNSVLQTKQTARGLVANMPDVLFATGKSTLKPDARIRLAKVAGIILAYPDLKLEIDGYTDSTGSDELNQRLSEQRAANVRDFMVSQGVDINNVIARGFGKTDPIASNDTASGRQQNRRVELVVNGTSIGTNAQGQAVEPPVVGSNTGGTSGAVGSGSASATPADNNGSNGNGSAQSGAASNNNTNPGTTPHN